MGYPRFSSLIGSHIAFTLFRSFSIVRARLLLAKQDKVAILEARLEEIDASEQRPLFLGSLRKDQNVERGIVLRELDMALQEYGTQPLGYSEGHYNYSH
jgi:hypothetical protein